MVTYEWDPRKAQRNREKHGVSFADAVSVFEDPLALTMLEATHGDEQRLVSMGMDLTGKLLVVVYTWRGSTARIFSARRATRSERRQYESGG